MAFDAVLVANAGRWPRKANDDFQRINRRLAEEPPDCEDALFHCQQAAEKALKAFLTWHDVPFRKTHDLAVLGQQCVKIDGTMSGLAGRLDDLTEYAWVYRYPEPTPEPSPADVAEACALASEVIEEVGRRLPLEVRAAAES